MSATDVMPDTPPAPAGPWRRLLCNRTAVFALIVLVALVGLAVAAPYLTNAQPLRISPGIRLKPPRQQNLFGTDHLGRDMFALVLFGGRTSLLVGLLVTSISMSIAIVLGLAAGFYRRVDLVLMRLVDGLMAFPSIVLATAAAGYLGPSVTTVIVALSIVLVAPVLRVVRGQILVLRELPMIEAARATGVPDRRILSRYLFPAIVSPLLVQASLDRKSTRLNSSHYGLSRMPSSA